MVIFRIPLSAAACIAFAAALTTPPFLADSAHAQTIVGGSGRPGVSVNLELIKELGPAPSVADVLSSRYGRAPAARLKAPFTGPKFPDIRKMGRSSSVGRVVLRPPGSKPRRAATVKRRAKKRRARVAPKPAPVKRPVAAPKPPAAVAKLPPQPKRPARAAPTVVTRKPIPPPPPARVAKPVEVAKVPPPPVAADIPAPAMEPPPPVAKAPQPPKQTASLPPADQAVTPGRSIRLIFPAGSVKLSAGAKSRLEAVAQAMSKNDNYRLQLLAYASGSSKTASRARRLSLSRALAARLHLIDKDVRSTRIDVRALGNKSEQGPPDRIDLMVSAR